MLITNCDDADILSRTVRIRIDFPEYNFKAIADWCDDNIGKQGEDWVTNRTFLTREFTFKDKCNATLFVLRWVGQNG